MIKLVLLRHGESEWNLANRFTGWTDVDLTETGIKQALSAGQILKQEGFEFDKETYAEVRIGLVNEDNDELDDVFARMLISLDPDHKACHMMWKRD